MTLGAHCAVAPRLVVSRRLHLVEIYPVLDIRGGVVVHAVRGQRDSYQELRSRWAQSAEPVEVAAAVRQQFGLSTCYVADLDALGGGQPALETFAALKRARFRLLVDAGSRDVAKAELLFEHGVDEVVVALESSPELDELAALVERCGSDRIVFSLDLMGGVPMGTKMPWGVTEPRTIARAAYGAGVRRMILLDLAYVGSDAGPVLAKLLGELNDQHPDVSWITGGGVRSIADLEAYERAGASAVLVATALHDGRLVPPLAS